MRSRYAAFSLGLGEYLVRTLAEEHADRTLPQGELVLSLSRARERQRFLGLRILWSSSEGDRGEVLFYARVFERGADRSFAELSTFRREGVAWRYSDALLVPADRLPRTLDTIDKLAFLALTDATRHPATDTDDR
jgi:SEC-C motif domain protein